MNNNGTVKDVIICLILVAFSIIFILFTFYGNNKDSDSKVMDVGYVINGLKEDN